MIDLELMSGVNAKDIRKLLGDGNFGGYYERPDEEMHALWDVAVAETRSLLEHKW
jgi:creatinine amidohydrolase